MKITTIRLSATAASLVAALILLPTTPAVAAPGAADTLADFEGPETPPGFFTFAGGSSVTATAINVGDSDPLARPGQVGDNGVLEVVYGVSDFGGFGDAYQATGPRNWSNYRAFDFWFYGTGSGLTYQAEIFDNRSDPNTDTSERFDYEFTDSSPGWQYISIPFEDFTRATDFQPGGAPDDGFTLTEIWGWAIVLPMGADIVNFDDFATGLRIIDDFESELPNGTDGDGNSIGFYTFQGAGSTVAIGTAVTPPAPTLPTTPWTPGSHRTGPVMTVSASGCMAKTVALRSSSTCWKTVTRARPPTMLNAGCLLSSTISRAGSASTFRSLISRAKTSVTGHRTTA
jgi:hypothetical protein